MADPTTSSPPLSNGASPLQRPSSPSPSVSPSLALDAVPSLDRSVSTPSTSTASSIRSRQSRLSDGGATVVRRRGYMRPQGTPFADSARNRDSVMSLGSIAHMQYYFARTGLLDGKGAQLAKEREKELRKRSTLNLGKENLEPSMSLDDLTLSSLSLHDGASSYAVSDPGQDCSVMESPTELTESGDAWSTAAFRTVEPPMLPPTVSTYKQKPSYTEPLPDMPVLRRELKEALQDACKVLEETQKNEPASESSPEGQEGSNPANGFHEIQGLHLLDIITLAIRAAKNYYTAHSNPQRLYTFRSEKNIRADLYKVLDVLKRMASRNFSGGMRMMELTEILLWIESIDQLLRKEDELERQETEERERWVWREGDWAGREREREWLFLKACDTSGEEALPQWEEASSEPEAEQPAQPTAFIAALADGQRLVKLHNAMVARSKRNFGEIKTWHSDVAKPYRRAENLRFWIKAAELRWEVKLTVPVSDVVNGSTEASVWEQFETAVMKWCRGVREELTEEWRQEAAAAERNGRRGLLPELRVEVPETPAPVEEGVAV